MTRAEEARGQIPSPLLTVPMNTRQRTMSNSAAMMTATALLVLAGQGRCQLEDPTGRYLASDIVDRDLAAAGEPPTSPPGAARSRRSTGRAVVSTAADLAAFLRALTRGQLVSGRAWSEMTRWQRVQRAVTTTTALDWVAIPACFSCVASSSVAGSLYSA